MDKYEQEHLELVRRLAPGCAVLLRSKGDFPLDGPCVLALYGSGARHTVKGGTGSGDVNSRCFTTVEEGLEKAGFTISTRYWLDTYDALRRAAKEQFAAQIRQRARANHTVAVIEGMGAVMPEPEYRIPLYGEGETAVYVLSRISGEGNDRSAERGDILLTETEERDILALNRKYKRFLLVLNVGGVVDLSSLSEVGNILYLGQLGAPTGDVLADLLLGRAYPSGKLTTTWSAWEDYCTEGDFGDINETHYREGVYVGYRYFDSVGKKALFPFGFGLGYTSFSLKPGAVTLEGESVCLSAVVSNTGARPGRETAQVYVSAPQGKLDRPYQELAAFRKTRELQPGESEELSIRFSLRELAAFDAKAQTWVLEKGDYLLRLGTSSRDTAIVAVVRLDRDAVTLHTRRFMDRKPGFEDWRPEEPIKHKTPRFTKILKLSADSIEERFVDYDRADPVEPAAEELSVEELAMMSVGAHNPALGALSIIGNASMAVPGAAGESCGAFRDRGIPSLIMADGPAGLRLSRDYYVDEKGPHPLRNSIPADMEELLPAFVRRLMELGVGRSHGDREVLHQYCTAIPIGTMLAQSWDPEAAVAFGDLVGEEMLRFGVHLWLAPALNIHRDIRCGRNFEYFSEDPLISGRMAAALTRGVQKHPGCGTTVKHFTANNQERNRYYNNSRVSERAMREIYLRGFGICVRESQPRALMTSYNLLNGTHTSERRRLLEDVLRCEFGFDGVVMTDWIIPALGKLKGSVHGAPHASEIAAAGNDLTMPGNQNDVNDILRAVEKGKLEPYRLRVNVSRILRLAKELTEAGQ